MRLPGLQTNQLPRDHRGNRVHRFMESTDIGCAFRETFVALRANVRRGLCADGQVYALEMDSCIPGEMLDTFWLPAAAFGVVAGGRGCTAHHPDSLPGTDRPDAARERQALLRRLLRQPGAPALVAWVGEQTAADGMPVVRVEIASADGLYAAQHLVCPGRCRRRRELLRGRHHCCTNAAPA